jgi:hypothetical protein
VGGGVVEGVVIGGGGVVTLLLRGIIACYHRSTGPPLPEPCAVEVNYGGRSRLEQSPRVRSTGAVASPRSCARVTPRPGTRGRGHSMADKSPRQHQSKKSGKSLKEKREEKKTKQATKRPIT